MKDPVTASLGGGSNITGATDNLVSSLVDIDRTLRSLEELIGYTDIECKAEQLPTTPDPANEMEDNLNAFLVDMVGIKLRVRRLEQELTRVFNRLGIMTHREVENANQ